MPEQIPYTKTFPVLWSDLDPNGHMRGPRYLEYAAEMPFHFLVDNGFDFRMFVKAQIGPVTFKQQVIHLVEVRFGDRITIDHKLRGLSSDASRWAFRHRIVRADGKHAATVEAEGAFFSLSERKITAPPINLAELIRRLPRDEDFKSLEDH
jgi:acyl-CoA thioester hydrolase